MKEDEEVHFARLESPSDAFRSVCGAWRRAQNWTTLPALVTCRACLGLLPSLGLAARPAESPRRRAAPAPDLPGGRR